MRRAIALTIVLFLLPSVARAACWESDLEGSYALSAETRGALGTFWTTCEVSIAADGRIEPGTTCVQRDAAGLETRATVEGGAIVLARSCKVTGSIIIAGYESVVTKARMSRDKWTVEGKAINAADGSTVSFFAARLL